ncbi:MAG: hypothetical protein MK212_21980, partial [Saprospiraceae bacterium]|nr:hypothetical protein [Saprospiraceae bacterium]
MKQVFFTLFLLHCSIWSIAQYWNFDAKNIPIRRVNGLVGNAVAMNDQYAIVGTPGYSFFNSFPPITITSAGTAAVLEKDASGHWVMIQNLLPNLLQGNFDQAGSAVALEGNIAVVGAPFANSVNRQNCGRIDIYTRDATLGWEYTKSFYGSYSNENLGTSLAMKDGRIYAGAPNYNNAQGLIQIYKQDALGTWNTEATIVGYTGTNRFFGSSIAAKDSTVFIGVPGSSQVVRCDKTTTWSSLFSQVIYGTMSQTSNDFGSSIAIHDSLLVIGAPAHNNNEGLAFALLPNPATGDWEMVDTIYNPSPMADEYFGAQVSVYQNKVVIASPEEKTDANNANPLNEAGAAFIYYDWDNNNQWSLLQKIISPDRD